MVLYCIYKRMVHSMQYMHSIHNSQTFSIQLVKSPYANHKQKEHDEERENKTKHEKKEANTMRVYEKRKPTTKSK